MVQLIISSHRGIILKTNTTNSKSSNCNNERIAKTFEANNSNKSTGIKKPKTSTPQIKSGDLVAELVGKLIEEQKEKQRKDLTQTPAEKLNHNKKIDEILGLVSSPSGSTGRKAKNKNLQEKSLEQKMQDDKGGNSRKNKTSDPSGVSANPRALVENFFPQDESRVEVVNESRIARPMPSSFIDKGAIKMENANNNPENRGQSVSSSADNIYDTYYKHMKSNKREQKLVLKKEGNTTMHDIAAVKKDDLNNTTAPFVLQKKTPSEVTPTDPHLKTAAAATTTTIAANSANCLGFVDANSPILDDSVLDVIDDKSETIRRRNSSFNADENRKNNNNKIFHNRTHFFLIFWPITFFLDIF